MRKEARKASSDPAQEAIRAAKATWNKKVSEFIGDLIAFKKMFNGWHSKFYPEKYRIFEKMNEVPVIIGSLAGDFQDLANEATKITNMQSQYADSRKQKQPKKADLNNDLVKEANAITQFLSKFKGPFFGSSPAARERQYRISTMNVSAKILKDLKHLKSLILDSSEQAAFEASKLSDNILTELDSVTRTFNVFKPEEKEDKKDKDNKDKEDQSDPLINESLISSYYKDYIDVFSGSDFNNKAEVPQKNLVKLTKLFNEFSKNKNIDSYNNFINFYNETLILAKANISDDVAVDNVALRTKINNATSFKDVQDILNNNKTAAISDVFKSIKHQILPSKDSGTRLDAVRKIESSKSLMEEALKSLENEFNIDSLREIFKKALSELIEISEITKIISNRYLNESYYKNLNLDKDERKMINRKKRMSEINKLLK